MEREEVLNILEKIVGCNELDPTKCMNRECAGCEFSLTEEESREAVKYAYEYMKENEK